MGNPAARVGDMHVCPMVDGVKPHVGGPIVGPGVPTVLIGGMPAAVQGDMCTCASAPDTIAQGSTGVLIGGKPAARMGDMTAHGGSIVMGCMTVLIGASGGGAGGGSGGAGGSEPEKAIDDIIRDKIPPGGHTPGGPGGKGGPANNNPPPIIIDKADIGFKLVNPKGKPLDNVRYQITLPDGSSRSGQTNKDGEVLIKGIKPGQCKISFPDIHADEWS